MKFDQETDTVQFHPEEYPRDEIIVQDLYIGRRNHMLLLIRK